MSKRLAVLAVTSLNISGAGCLRQALSVPNVTCTKDTIRFDAGIVRGTPFANGGRVVPASGKLWITNDATIEADVDDDRTAATTAEGGFKDRISHALDASTDAIGDVLAVR